jgi:effector-binding domain-containing protein
MASPAVQIQRVGSVPLVVIRRQARMSELSRVVPECCGLVWNEIRAQQTKAGRNVAVYWDLSIRLEVGVELQGAFVEQNGVVRSATPAGEVACGAYFGPYSGLGAAHGSIQRWCQENGRTLAGPSWEIYGHWQAEWNNDPSQIRTEVYYQLAG